MTTPEQLLTPVFQVRVEGTVPVNSDEITTMLAKIAGPRPGQEFTVKIDPENFAADVVYIRLPDAPAHRVTYLELARAWGELVGEGRVYGQPDQLSTGDALQVVDRACMHITARRAG